MVRIQKSGKSLANARITIDYKNKKVKYQYVEKLSTYKQIAANLDHLFILPWTAFFAYYFIKTAVKSVYIDATPHMKAVFFFTFVFLYIFYRYGVSYLQAYIVFKCDKFRTWAVKFNSSFNTKQFMEFKNINSREAVIPWFRNIFLKWKATEDYAKYLERIEIKEVPYLLRKEFHHGKRYMLPNKSKFYAKFFFSKVPKKGSLQVTFT
jgi:hypothetical protein